jgi:hypothetical protein
LWVREPTLLFGRIFSILWAFARSGVPKKGAGLSFDLRLMLWECKIPPLTSARNTIVLVRLEHVVQRPEGSEYGRIPNPWSTGWEEGWEEQCSKWAANKELESC